MEATLRWFALTVRHQHEKRAALALAHRGIEHLLPLYRVWHRWSDRSQPVTLPLFPGYLFCRLAGWDCRPALTAPGVHAVVAFGGRAAPVADEEIANLRAVAAAGLNPEPWPYLRVGERVRIGGGPLRGLEGVLVRAGCACRLVLNVELLERSVAVEVDRAVVLPADHGFGRRIVCAG